MATHDSTRAPRRPHRPLLDGHRIRCPRCKRLHDILAYTVFEQIEEYADETNPVMKCPHCRWIFSPGPHTSELTQLLTKTPPAPEQELTSDAA